MSAASDPSDGGEHARRARIVTTRAEPGRLDALLGDGGADVVHVALIATERMVDPAQLTARLEAADWVAATSRNGAAIVAESLTADTTGPGAAGPGRSPQLAAVGQRTADVLGRSGLPVAVVPSRQTAADLVDAFPDPAPGAVVVIVQAAQTDGTLGAGLRRRGYLVEEIVGYRTVARSPTAHELAACRSADVITFASGSAVAAWAALGVPSPATVVIGPSTAARAASLGVLVDAIADEHSVDGLARAALAVAGLRP